MEKVVFFDNLLGTYGVVKKAKRKGTGELRAIKWIKKELIDSESEKILQQEMEILRQLVLNFHY